MSNRVVKLFAVVALTSGTAAAGIPRALKSGAPACGNVMDKSKDGSTCAVKTAAKPRVLKTGAPAAGNVIDAKMSKKKSAGPAEHPVVAKS